MLGARGFSCAVSGFGQVLKSDPREKLRRSCLRPTADETKLPVTREKKTSGTQGRCYFPGMKNKAKASIK